MKSIHKTAMLTWAVVYPLITALLILLEPIVAELAMPLRTLILTAIMVPIMSYLAMPLGTRWASALLGSTTETHSAKGETK
ncbi:MAG: hypothetical protein AAF250_06630 [Pseudomonadota bacterium]